MRAGAVSAAALAAQPTTRNGHQRSRHCPQAEYTAFVRHQEQLHPSYRVEKLRHHRAFAARWPKLSGWFAAPLTERVGQPAYGAARADSTSVSHRARPYLLYLGLRGHATFDYAWMLAAGQLRVTEPAADLGVDLGTAALVGEAINLGFNPDSARQAMHWAASRIALHTGLLDATAFTEDHITELLEAIRLFGERADLREFYPSPQRYRDGAAKNWTTHLHQLQVVLFHRDQVATQPHKLMPSWAPPTSLPPDMKVVVERWLAARRLTDRPSTVYKLELALRRFGEWLTSHHPEVDSFSDVTRDHCLGFLQALAEEPTQRDGKPLGTLSRIQRTSGLAQFFRDTAAWQWDGVPGHTLLGPGDAPKSPLKVPRFIPDHELSVLMSAIAGLDCPFQRTSLLVARWSGARRGEIQRLPIDCLDTYPDGTPRLRLPAGKTYRERTVPMHEDGAVALRQVIELRAGGPERAFTDELTGTPTRYLFMAHGKLLSTYYLFDTPIQQACETAGLVDARGRGTITAHRFRHTVGTQLAERGAKLHTIMKVLGHTSVSMSLVYAQISDREVLRDYQAVLGAGAPIAGPASNDIRAGTLPDSTVDWLKTNFFKTELELGHCLRLPAEGPCECDLVLTCSKFVTTKDYAPRLRARLAIEQQLVDDALARGWEREVGRHQTTIVRIGRLLGDLDEPTNEESTDAKEAPAAEVG